MYFYVPESCARQRLHLLTADCVVSVASAWSFLCLGMECPHGASTLPRQRRRFRVRAAFFAAAERDRAERCLATRFACLDNARFDADRRLSRLSARFVARERLRDGFLRRTARPFARSRLA